MKFLKCKIFGILIFYLLVCSCAKEEQKEEQEQTCSKIKSDLKQARSDLFKAATSDTVEKYKLRSEATAVIGSAHIDIVKCLKESSACNRSLKKLGQFYITDSEFNLARYKSWKVYYESYGDLAKATTDSERAKANEDLEKAEELRNNEIRNTSYSSFHKKSSRQRSSTSW